MLISPANLSAHVQWRRLLPALGLEASSGALPHESRCPICYKSSLTTYQDTICGGEWHSCSSCRFAGDNIELAAGAWRASIPEAASRLVREGLLDRRFGREAAASYESWYLSRRTQTAKFLENSTGLPSSGTDMYYFRQFMDVFDSDKLCWQDRGGRLVKVVSNKQLTDYVELRKMWGSRAVRKRWSEAMIIPFHDLPGRVSAILIGIQNTSTGEPLYCYQHTFSAHPEEPLWNPPGVVAMDAVFANTPDSGMPLMVLLDPVLAAKIHIRHLQQSSAPLPVVGCRPDAPVPEILRLHAPGRRMVVWGHHADADLFRYARTLNAFVASHEGKDQLLTQAIRRYSTIQSWLALVNDQAKTWSAYLGDRLAKLSLPDAESMITRLSMSNQDLKKFLSTCPDELRTKLDSVRQVNQAGKRVVVDGRAIVEDEEGWRLAKSGELISNVILRIDNAITQPASGKVWYQGRLLFKGKEVPYTLPQESLEKYPLDTARRCLIEAKVGVPDYKKRWQTKAIEIAMGFQKPVRVDDIKGYGWDACRQRFIFHDFSIEMGGEVKSHTLPNLQPDKTPAVNIYTPMDVGGTTLTELINHPSAGLIMPTLLSVLYNLVVPAFSLPSKGVLLSGGRVSSAMMVATAAGCAMEVMSGGNQQAVNAVAKLEHPDGWPLAIENAPHKGTNWPAWLSKSRNCIVGVDQRLATILYLNGGWFMLDLKGAHSIDSAALDAVSAIVPDFIRFLMAKRLGKGLWGENAVDRLVTELVEYLDTRGVRGEAAVPHLSRLRHTGKGDSAYFGVLMARLASEGVFAYVDDRPAKRGSRMAPDTRPAIRTSSSGEGTVFIPHSGLSDILYRRDYPTLDTAAVTRALLRDGVGVSEVRINGELGWILPQKWWDIQQTRWRDGEKAEIRIAN